MTDTHPITPPPELVREWNQNAIGTHFPPYGYSEYIATQAARWGADQELEACCEWIESESCLTNSVMAKRLRAHRRPKPPSLKEQALEALRDLNIGLEDGHNAATIRRALESLPD